MIVHPDRRAAGLAEAATSRLSRWGARRQPGVPSYGTPLLRLPPFPDTSAVSVLSTPRPSALPAEIDAGRNAAVLSLIVERRVGGTFWAPPANLHAGWHVLLPGNRTDALAMIEAARADRDAPVLCVGWSPQWHIRAPGRCVDEVDPWSLLGSDATLHASHGHDVARLAAIVAHPIRLYGPREGEDRRQVAPDRGSIAQAIVADTVYHSPFDGDAITAEQAIDLLGDCRGWINANRSIAVAVGVTWWKRRALARLLWAPRDTPLRFAAGTNRAIRHAAAANGAIAVWPSRVGAGFVAEAQRAGRPLVRMEDGFVRSVGLGSNLHVPLSITLDQQGLHFDPAEPSDLEQLLQTGRFPPVLLARAAALRQAIVAARIGKYGPSAPAMLPARKPGSTRLVLVPGQVADDLSVRLGGAGLGNIDLLRATRQAEPDAEIWYRPHPDVDAGHRRGAIPDEQALAHADRVVRAGGMAQLLDIVDGIHVITSLSGFEALLRGRDVTTHGNPFFAGWGLTRDLGPGIARRTRRLLLDELVAATLILYPRYLDPLTALPCPVEVLVARFAEQVANGSSWLPRLRALQGLLAKRVRWR